MMNQIKTIIVAFGLLVSGVSLAATVDISTGASGSIDEYSVTINKLEIYNSTTGEWKTLSDTAKTINIASASAGSQVGSMVKNDITLTYGTYTQIKATVGGSFTLSACYNSSKCTTGSTVTDAAASASASSATATSVTVDFSNCGGCMANPPSGETRTAVSGGVEITYTLPTPFVMSGATSSMTSDIKFDIDDKLTYVGSGPGAPYITPAFPKVYLTLQ